MKKIRPIAMYLPQYHPIPENDLWWGEGFTEWYNVKKALPLFRNHYQPQLPVDLDFYDLRDPTTRDKQAEMAKTHGIYGFCYYHYWFNGKRLLNLPIDEVLRTHKPDFPFCLAWANENWTRAWDGQTSEVLIKQNHTHKDDLDHIRFLVTVFNDPRYIRVDGKPLFIIYKPELFPDIRKTLKTWRDEAVKIGIGDLYLCYFENRIQNTDPQVLGFDAAIEFQPNWKKLPRPMKTNTVGLILKRHGFPLNIYYKHDFFDYLEFVKIMIDAGQKVTYKRFRCVTPMWDNTARREKNATVFLNSSPKKYKFWLKSVLQDFRPFSNEENFIFLNAWNEWGEGNHLEPCQKWGYSYLEATKEVLLNMGNDHARAGKQLKTSEDRKSGITNVLQHLLKECDSALNGFERLKKRKQLSKRNSEYQEENESAEQALSANKVLKYDVFQSTQKMMFHLIEPGKKILDVGCGTGRLAEQLRLKKNCYVVGIERDELEAKFAQQRCDKLLLSDVEKLYDIPFQTGYFDVIIFADVLEHLLNPESVLRRFKKYLSENGYVFLSIPNVANWYIRLQLLLGIWNYTEVGLLDKTHIRFFTLKSVKEMIQRCGYTITYLGCTSGDWRFIPRNLASLRKGLFGYQFLIKAKRSIQLCKADPDVE
jgi:2-polyprenyl-3-methyl-5-hydroxy-6-metoxy-1,4-benzoquinol methylase